MTQLRIYHDDEDNDDDDNDDGDGDEYGDDVDFNHHAFALDFPTCDPASRKLFLLQNSALEVLNFEYFCDKKIVLLVCKCMTNLSYTF